MIAEIYQGKEWTAIVSDQLHSDRNRQAPGLNDWEKMSKRQLQLYRETFLKGS